MELLSLPVIAIIGRPNVGKSTLFNCLTRSKAAIVADTPGLTRDRHYGEAKYEDRRFIVIDTGGLGENSEAIDEKMAEQSWLATQEADKICFVVDAKVGLTPADQEILRQLRPIGKPIVLVMNKVDGVHADSAASDFFRMGLGEPYAVAASHGRGVQALCAGLLDDIPVAPLEETESVKGIKIAIVGRPNVGKSTLVNRMLGEERVIVFDMPGTTRDSLMIPMERHGKHYTLIDTAGVRRRGRVDEGIEKFSVIKALQSIENAHVVIMVLDATEGITDQDCHLLGFVIESGRSLVIAFNKWDGLDQDHRDWLKREIDRRLDFAMFARVHFISALHGTGVGDLYGSVEEAYTSATKKLPTPILTRILQAVVTEHQPPLVSGRRIKLRYAHAGGHNPPLIIIHGNQTDKLPMMYQRYLNNAFREALKIKGTPLRIEFKSSDNPYKDKVNKLTLTQERKRKRLLKHLKSRK